MGVAASKGRARKRSYLSAPPAAFGEMNANLGNTLKTKLQQTVRELEESRRAVEQLNARVLQLTRENLEISDQNRELLREKSKILRDLDKLQCVVDQGPAQPDAAVAPSPAKSPGRRSKRMGVSAPPPALLQLGETASVDESTLALLLRAMRENPYTGKLTVTQQRLIIKYMRPVEMEKGSVVIQEGDEGDRLYVCTDGIMEVCVKRKGTETMVEIMPGQVVGEMAILYSCRRTATITAKTRLKLWYIDRDTFKQVTRHAVQEQQTRLMAFLSAVPLLKGLSDSYIESIAELCVEITFVPGEVIVSEGRAGDSFYLILEGEVVVTQSGMRVRTLLPGEYFGEAALLSDRVRTATCTARDAVTCVTITSEAFFQYIMPLEALGRLSYVEVAGGNAAPSIKSEHRAIQLKDLVTVGTLGAGGFGRVELVRHRDNRIFALKMISKAHIIENGQEDHVLSERNTMLSLNSAFCCQLYTTFVNTRYIYMLLEPCLGGELWHHLRQRGKFDTATARFYTACVVEALVYMHGQRFVYRDLKPENMMIDKDGYVKMVDFGFAKRLERGKKTWTFCGTPDYMCPEIVMNQGHDFSADLWSLGIFIYEMLCGRNPFSSQDPMETYNKIVLGLQPRALDVLVDAEARDLVASLCREKPSERMGAQVDGTKAIKRHKWFNGFPWEALLSHTLPAPMVPKLSSAVDLRYFDSLGPASYAPSVHVPTPWADEF